jgi:hypothetical protein
MHTYVLLNLIPAVRASTRMAQMCVERQGTGSGGPVEATGTPSGPVRRAGLTSLVCLGHCRNGNRRVSDGFAVR